MESLEKLVGHTWIQIEGYGKLKKGDIFRLRNGSNYGTLMIANADPVQIPHRNDPKRLVWSIKSDFYR